MSAFLQTLLWVGLIAWALLRFEKVIGALVGAVTKRIEDGDELAAPGGFRIGVRQTSAAEEKDQLQKEAQEAVRNGQAEGAEPPEPVERVNQAPQGESPFGREAKNRTTYAAALRNVSDAKSLGLKWLGMTLGAQVLPNVTVGKTAFDGLLKQADGTPRGLVAVKLVNSISQLERIFAQIKEMADVERISNKDGPLRIAVVLVRSDRLQDKSLWPYIPTDFGHAVDWYEIDLPQLRQMYGLKVEPETNGNS